MENINNILILEGRIKLLTTEIVMGNYYDGWSLEGMNKEVERLKAKLKELKEDDNNNILH